MERVKAARVNGLVRPRLVTAPIGQSPQGRPRRSSNLAREGMGASPHRPPSARLTSPRLASPRLASPRRASMGVAGGAGVAGARGCGGSGGAEVAGVWEQRGGSSRGAGVDDGRAVRRERPTLPSAVERPRGFPGAPARGGRPRAAAYASSGIKTPRPDSPPTVRPRLKAVPPGMPSPKAPAGPRLLSDAVPPPRPSVKLQLVFSTCYHTSAVVVMNSSSTGGFSAYIRR
jgi:hypothetical protein